MLVKELDPGIREALKVTETQRLRYFDRDRPSIRKGGGDGEATTRIMHANVRVHDAGASARTVWFVNVDKVLDLIVLCADIIDLAPMDMTPSQGNNDLPRPKC